jgi:hypothetical protein
MMTGCLGLMLLLVWGGSLVLTASPPQPHHHTTPSRSPPMLTITVTLAAREETLPPLGLPPDPQRDRAFATVFLRLENPREIRQTLTLEAIEIRSDPEKQLEPFAFEPRVLALQPLEHAVIDIQLSKPAPYRAKDRLRAIVRYRLGDQPEAMVASDAVAIERR